ncbi:MAG: DUF3047 domain-containing protein [Candidatus Binatia bacterium]
MEADSRRTHALLERISAEERARLLADVRLLHLPGNVAPWTDGGIRLARGDRVTFLSAGKVYLSTELDLWAGPRFHLWAKVGEQGTIFNGTRDTYTFESPSDGPLFLAIYQGEWASRDGTLATPVEMYQTCGGGLDVLVIRWKVDPAAGLARLRQLAPDDPLLRAESERLASPVAPPEGWRYLWFLGESEIFRDAEPDGRHAIAVHADGDVGILRKPLDVELRPETTLSWRWRISELPSKVAEDTMPTHDYVSIAAEFDDGRDLTWYWSAALPVGATYACPLPTWAARETHTVVRSGRAGLGEWHAERRNVYEEAKRVYGAAPRRIVGVWLIAVSLFQHGTLRAEFADITIGGGP